MARKIFDLTGKTVWVAGHRGMVGSAIIRQLKDSSVANIVTSSSTQVDLVRQEPTEAFLFATRPDVAIIAAAKVGGVHANRSAQGEFLYDNLMIAANCVEAARRAEVEKVVVLGSSCIYPRTAPQPMREDHLLTGPLEATNEGYAIAKIAGLELAKMYRRQYDLDAISLMPTNLYGPNDNFDLANSHVLPALLRKIHEAKNSGDAQVEVWGSGRPRREFLHVDDLAAATLFAIEHYTGEGHLNVGIGKDITIRELAETIASTIGWDGELRFNPDMPDGAPRKLLDVSRLAQLGWSAEIGLREGIEATYRWFLRHGAGARGVGQAGSSGR